METICNEINPWPHVYRVDKPECVGVKTYFRNAQYGEACKVSEGLPPEKRQGLLDRMERDLRAEIKHYGG